MKYKSRNKFKLQLLVLLIGFIVPFALNIATQLSPLYISNIRLPGTEDWIYYTYQKKDLYAKSIKKTKKIVIISGSNALFGLSAKQIENKLKIPTVNYAVHAGLGIDFSFYKATKILSSGDVVILPFEYSNYFQSRIFKLSKQPLLFYTLSYEIAYFNQFSLLERLWILTRPNIDVYRFFKDLINGNLFKHRIESIIEKRREKKACYSALLNINGDELCNNDVNLKKDKLPGIVPDKTWKINLIDPDLSIANFVKYCKSQNIKIIPLYPVALKNNKSLNSNSLEFYFKIKQFWEKMGINFNDNPHKSFLEKNLILDTNYHPTDEGRKQRTQWVIELLTNELDK